MTVLAALAVAAGVAVIVWGAETFAEHLGRAAAGLGVTTFALALLLAGAEPEELATSVAASLRHTPGIALGDVIGANVTVYLVALGLAAVMTPLVFGVQVRRYALLALPVGVVAAWIAWSGRVTRLGGAALIGLYLVYVAITWMVERRPPALGEVGEALKRTGATTRRQGGRHLGPGGASSKRCWLASWARSPTTRP